MKCNCRLFVAACLACALPVFTGCGAPGASDPVGNGDRPLPIPGTVSPTSHPLVASYNVTAPVAGTVSVELGTSVSYGRSTGIQTISAGGMVNLLVAGMKPQTTYHMRARVVSTAGVLYVDSDHTFQSGSLPSVSFPAVTVAPPGLAASGGVDLISGLGPTVSAVVFDTDGSVIWYYYDPSVPAGSFAFPIRQLDNGDFIIVNNVASDVREVNLAGQIVRQVTLAQLNTSLAAAGYSLATPGCHHDVLPLANGHWILLVYDYREFQDLPGYPGTTTVLGDALVDLDANNQPVWVWRAFDHLDVNRHPYLFPDWTHSNTLVHERDGSLLLSMRNQSWVLKIDYANGAGSGDVVWRLGPGGDFTLSVNDPAQWFYNQHYPYLLQTSGSTQQMALFDNGNTRPDNTGQPCTTDCFSRALILSIDESARTAQITWQYSPGWYSLWGGSIVVLPNNNVEFDSTAPSGGYSRILEVTQTSTPQTVWEMDTSNTDFYRAYRIPSLYPGVLW